MAKYIITVTEFEEKTIHDRQYIGVGKEGANKDGYKFEDHVEEVQTRIYEQNVKEINLKAIIDAVNKQPENKI